MIEPINLTVMVNLIYTLLCCPFVNLLTSVFSCSLTTTVPEEVTEESDIYLEIADPANDNLDIRLGPAVRKQKKKEKKARFHKKSSMESEGIYFVPILACERTILYNYLLIEVGLFSISSVHLFP